MESLFDENKFFVPQYLHRPYQVLFFEVDELALFFVLLTLALMFSGIILWGLTIVSPFILSYLKRKFPRGYLKHALYIIGLVSFKKAPTFFEDRMIE